MAEEVIHRCTVPMTRKDSSAMQEQVPSSVYDVNKHDSSSRSKSGKMNLKRADSYKQATNRLSIYDNLSNNVDIFNDHGGDHETKYNTLPVNSKLNLPKWQSKTQTMNGYPSGHSDAICQNVSQKSGSLPSPDTDEDQRPVPDIRGRKRKMWFGRSKQHHISAKKESDDDNRQKDKKHSMFRRQKVSDKDKTEHTNNRPSVVKISHLEKKSYTEQHSSGKNGMSRTTEKSESVDIKSEYGGSHWTHKETYTKEVTKEPDISSTKQGPFHFLSRLRKSLRKKKKGSPKQKEHSIPKEAGLTDTAAGLKEPLQSDVITDIFEALIDPSLSVSHASVPPKKADRSKLHLDGLRKARPAKPEKESFCKSYSYSVTEREFIDSHHRFNHEIDVETHEHESEVLTPTVEFDGPAFDFADGPEQIHGEVNAEAEFSQADDTERNRRVTDVAHRLQQIGDQIIIRRESSQSSSEPEGGSNLSSLVEYLRSLGDNADSRYFQQRVSDLTPVIVPVIRNLIMAETYDRFQSVIRQELQDTVGWEQVAWYTYLTRSAILVVSHGRQVGSQLKEMARHYFLEHIRPFIEQQPNGWDSVTEETDGELD
ncbi:hypothetical protein CHS0354_032289 [Potamilus streckersoni]|uniref:Uncharacterized protein n=1 Tax=Potamilus streckersoni TaxID=2493646 RepID=A0AAE0VGV6_9BIVA|nr:hypothetical protein CHS0354_032289 [Potamilus streckersoni]